MSNRVGIAGAKEIQDLLGGMVQNEARNLLRATVQGVAAQIAKEARQAAPKDRGTLRKAIKARRRKSHPDAPTSVVYVEHGKGVKNDAFYWRFTEYGTSGKRPISAKPYLGPAVEKARGEIGERMRDEFWKRYEKLLERKAKQNAKRR